MTTETTEIAKAIGDASYVAELLTDLGHGAKADLVRMAVRAYEDEDHTYSADDRNRARVVLVNCRRYRASLQMMKGTVYAKSSLHKAINRFKEEMDV